MKRKSDIVQFANSECECEYTFMLKFNTLG